MNYCLIGAPGVGKGTFSKLLVLRLKLHHISVGDIVRQEITQKSNIGKQALKFVNKGTLIPDDIVSQIVEKEMKKFQISNILLDGYPRNINQAKQLDQHLSTLSAISIQVDREVSVEKLLGRRVCAGCDRSFNMADIRRDGYDMPAILPGEHKTCPLGEPKCAERRVLEMRSDDTRDTIMKRFEVFDRETAPVLKYYRDSHRLKVFHVKRGVDDIDDLVKVMLS
mmetsp:Transcript_13020/g.21287  ORF Transcript_13020/g.21287 Transcript_13020/m.21287 type:complete len:224 (-) Transcript_13020:137-808(-)|eukprot:CAMPEP_0114432386 /NCGR_PEP_ID=MMETSP0103-20121206/11128_1 /TAXON_ID=37642 ORGANISM="Paraphysomonas imperforata, Strain PA2" /NCGR_SAMPLE_ID=MMETSP0103 /ASSEMBLY_ACC=CAM_ASM_000201 /LENGTH=223 /DNA_ID=CAMNT_0001602059 /DNA_START=187 /DNA_END=858 /DNA_ORIENTATION=+